MHFYLSAMLCRYVNSIIANDHNVIPQEREAAPQCRVVSVCATAQRVYVGRKFAPTQRDLSSHNRRPVGQRTGSRSAQRHFIRLRRGAASANLCPFATNARRRSMLWSKVASISRLAPTVFHGGRQTCAVRALPNGVSAARPPGIVNACVH